jgi:RecA-family ATPase
MVYGDPSTYKSFLVMDIAFCVASGHDWNDRKVAHGDVLYLAGEGHKGIQKRMMALEEKYQCSAPDIHVSKAPTNFHNSNAVDEVLKEIALYQLKPKLIVIDTMHRNFLGDENSSKDVGILIQNLSVLRDKTKAAILLVHHSGHVDKGHSRGSSAIRGSLDTEFRMKKNSDGIATLMCTKMKEFEEPVELRFELAPLSIMLPSSIVESTAYIQLTDTVVSNRIDRNQQALIALERAIDDKGRNASPKAVCQHPNLGGKKGVTKEEWRAEAYKDYANISQQSTKSATFRRASKNLIDAKVVIEVDGYFYLA